MVESSCTQHPQVTPLAITPRKAPDCFSGPSSKQLSSCLSLPRGGKLRGLFSPCRTLCVPEGRSRKAPRSSCTKASEMGARGPADLAPHGSRCGGVHADPQCLTTASSPASGRAATGCHLPSGGKKWQRAVILPLSPKRKSRSLRHFGLTRCKT